VNLQWPKRLGVRDGEIHMAQWTAFGAVCRDTAMLDDVVMSAVLTRLHFAHLLVMDVSGDH
jgi:hypothetical protein